jgi:hypothetical protein
VHPLIPVVNASHLPVQTVPAVTRSAQSKKRKNRNAEGSTSGSTIISETVSTQSIFAIDCSEKRLSKLLGNRQDLFRPFKSAIESTRERNYIGPKDSQKNGMKFFKPEKGYPTEIKIGSSGARLFCIKEVRDGIPTYIPTKFKAKHK